MKKHLGLLTAFCTLISTSILLLHAEDSGEERIFPPPMPQREIAPSADPLPGRTNLLEEAEYQFTLFVPEKWAAPASGAIDLTVHFHGATWYAIQEHLRGGLNHPMIAFHGGEGSGRYQRPFKDAERFGRWLKKVEEQLKQDGAAANAKITGVSLSSYSAGYGAIREILQSTEYRKLIKRVVMADSMYADYGKDAAGNATKTPVDTQIDPYVPFAQAAARGEKTFVITFSQVTPGPYASSADCAAALAKKMGGMFEEVELDSSPAANDADFPLVKRCDLQNLHLWGYAGTSPEAHMTHARHIADIWLILDEAKKP